MRRCSTAAAPGLLVAQAIGRIGNWWNQELFGKPTDLPWGLEIDPEHRPDEYLFDATFHPTFLYEALWNLFAAGRAAAPRAALPHPPAGLFALYIALYSGFRFWIEMLRVDPAHEIAGLRVNAWVSAVLFVLAVAVFVWLQLLRGRRRRPPPRARSASRGRRWPSRAAASDRAASLRLRQ